jgi:hypothetical protein
MVAEKIGAMKAHRKNGRSRLEAPKRRFLVGARDHHEPPSAELCRQPMRFDCVQNRVQ